MNQVHRRTRRLDAARRTGWIAFAIVSAAAMLPNPASAAQRTVYREERSIHVLEGARCKVYSGGRGPSGAQAEFSDQVQFPRWANRANVVLNGFYARYTSDDHHVKLLDVFIDQAWC